jgi:hypothetical protein
MASDPGRRGTLLITFLGGSGEGVGAKLNEITSRQSYSYGMTNLTSPFTDT